MRKLLLACVILLGVFPAATMAGHDDCGGRSAYRGGHVSYGDDYGYDARPRIIHRAPRYHSEVVIVIEAQRHGHHVRSHGHHMVRHHGYDRHHGGHRSYR
jgi:hypothetical protein